MFPASEALSRLREGNQRFETGHASRGDLHPRDLSGGQAPIAVILGCADARVPAEIVFDQGPGDLFVVRVIGNIATATQIGSIEFAASALGVRLIVVLGHEDCSAVRAALEPAAKLSPDMSAHLRTIVDQIRPGVTSTDDHDQGVSSSRMRRAVRDNVMAQTERLRAASTVLQQLEQQEGLMLLPAEYSLRTGRVRFFA